ncbi:ABC transporter ATP-binding protein [Desulfogranum japonicum]|uniref:ABC transporter ATP-binding protein n=1 Tax=Desulfogranum japonicum TaxID=231447 RepID=UPI0003FA8CE5|nr:ABC transporter ATP-binding protein [Desulfogranum japonicum]
MKILQFQNLSKSYTDKSLFSNVNLYLEQGQIIGIIGPSGQGKSTLLKIAAGLVKPGGGKIVIGTSRVGYVFQEPRLLPWYSARDNIALALHPLGYSSKKALHRADELLEKMELSGFESYYPDELSGGMQQRVSICRAVSISPELLLLDEPFTGLDPNLRLSIRSYLENIFEDLQAAIVHVTHDTKELLNGTCAVYTLTGQGLVDCPMG